MPRDPDGPPDVGPPLHPNRLLHEMQRLRTSAKLGKLSGLIEVFTIQVLHIRHDVRRTPRDEFVAAQDDGRRAGKRGADDVEVAGGQMREIPERWNLSVQMRIVREK